MKDRAAFDQMFKEWYTPLVYSAYYLINDIEACKDIVSDAFEYLWRNYDKIEKSTAKSYVQSIIRTRSIDYLRKMTVHEEYIEFVSHLMDPTTENGYLQADERVLRLKKGKKRN